MPSEYSTDRYFFLNKGHLFLLAVTDDEIYFVYKNKIAQPAVKSSQKQDLLGVRYNHHAGPCVISLWKFLWLLKYFW